MKRIGLTLRTDICNEYQEQRDAIDIRWYKFMEKCRFFPVLIPNLHVCNDQLVKMLSSLHGFILTGGNDLESMGGNARQRDQLESQILALASDRNIPVIGVCRGMQLMIEYFGGCHVPVEGHVANKVPIISGGKLRYVNSYHRWGTKIVPQQINITARSSDGVVKAIDLKSLRMTGMMWHPEREETFDSNDINFFKNYFV